MTEPFEQTPPPPEGGPPATAGGEERPSRTRLVWAAAVVVVLVAVVAVVVVAATRSDDGTTRDSAASSPSTFSTARFCKGGSWPAQFDGRPSRFDLGDDPGFFVWRNPDGWSVRLRGVPPGSSIVLTASGRVAPESVSVDPAGVGTVSVQGNTATFVGGPSPEAQGIDFDACTYDQFRLDLLVDGDPAPPNSVFTGPDNQALENPLLIERS